MFDISKLGKVVFDFRYRIGEKFIDDFGNITEITGYNYLLNCYQATITFKVDGTAVKVQSSIIQESNLSRLKIYKPIEELAKVEKGVNYKIYYFDNNPTKELRGQKAENITITLYGGVRALAKMLNSMKKRNPHRKITMVAIVSDTGIYLDHVRFIPQEIKTQKFLTGMKERLLAHAKYERGYEVAIGF